MGGFFSARPLVVRSLSGPATKPHSFLRHGFRGFRVDAAGASTYLNRRWFDFSGQTPGPPPDSLWGLQIHPDDAAPTAASWGRSLRTGEPFEVKYRFRNRAAAGLARPVAGSEALRRLAAAGLGRAQPRPGLIDAAERAHLQAPAQTQVHGLG